MKLKQKIKNLSLKVQLVVGIMIIHGLLICLFTYDLILKQKENINNQYKNEALAIAKSFAGGNVPAVMASDYAGLNEMIHALSQNSEVLYSFVYLPDGKILAHSNEKYVGTYLSDKKSLMSLQTKDLQTKFIENNEKFIDVAHPLIFKNEIIAWIRIRLDKSNGDAIINKIILKGFIYTILSLLIGFIFSLWIVNTITNQLNHLILLAKKVEEGDLTVRASLDSKNEVGRLADVFNSMLDTLNKDKHDLFQSQQLLKKSEERFELAMTGSNDGIWDYDIISGIVYFSPRWLAILGLSAGEIDPNVNSWISRLHPDDLEHAQSELKKHLQGHTTHYECEHRLLHKNGNYVWTLGRGVGVRGEDGKVFRIVGTQTDLTLQKNAEVEKEKIYNQLRQSQ